ncbi:hypothetical protein NPX13_g2297 [Xylaria arbuscula]|uniref:Uncharacterized protein n=1 Tax=Xylaria arbuscula TaxID=114810 RepID=A0A9W8TQH5_9PEZI|nr:hypothetical protein NPX13_g2297 [Xylaria arbuscula]
MAPAEMADYDAWSHAIAVGPGLSRQIAGLDGGDVSLKVIVHSAKRESGAMKDRIGERNDPAKLNQHAHPSLLCSYTIGNTNVVTVKN